jgi:hypothetical protein
MFEFGKIDDEDFVFVVLNRAASMRKNNESGLELPHLDSLNHN